MSKSLQEHFNDLSELPHWNWRMALSKSMPQYTRVSFNPRAKEGVEITPEDLEAFSLLFDEYEELFGLNPFAIDLDHLENLLTIKKLDLFITKDRVIENDINRILSEIQDLKGENKQVDILDTDRRIIHLVKWWGVPLDEKKISVIQFNMLVEERNEDIKRQVAALTNVK